MRHQFWTPVHLFSSAVLFWVELKAYVNFRGVVRSILSSFIAVFDPQDGNKKKKFQKL